jgi:hypothetical protein
MSVHETKAMANRTSAKKKESSLLAALSAALSDEELRRTLVAALLALDHAGMSRLARRLGTETGGLVRRIVYTKPVDGRRTKPAAGSAKIRQEWESAWAEWEECVAESGDEDGKYVLQEHEWEAPYFDTEAVASDLERVASRIRPLLPHVIDECLCKPAFRFAEVLRETADAIGGGLPEWMDGSWEPAWFGPEVTGCLLEAEWRMAERARKDAFEYVDAILALDQSLGNAGLDGQAIVAFVLDLPAAEQRAILAGIDRSRQSGLWKRVLGTAGSSWSRMTRKLERRRGPERHRRSIGSASARDRR